MDRRTSSTPLSRSVVTALTRVAQTWSLTPEAMAGLLRVDPTVWQDWQSAPERAALTAPQILIASEVLALHRQIRSRLRTAAGDRWMAAPQPEPPLSGLSPRDYLTVHGPAGLPDIRDLVPERRPR